MKIFLSYSRKYPEIAEDLCCNLQAEGHDVFFDREDLPAGGSYHGRIFDAIESCALFIFLISPEAVSKGHYTRTELSIAMKKWPTPGWHVLPVMVAQTPMQDIPAYLRALTFKEAEGDLVAEVVLEVQRLVRQQENEPLDQVRKPAQSDLKPLSFRALQLRFGRNPDGHYSLKLSDGAASDFSLDALQLEQALWANAQLINGSARRADNGSVSQNQLPTADTIRQVGTRLFNALFETPLRANLEQSMRDIDPQRGEGVRFVIDTTEAPGLARLPWEFLYSPAKDDFIFSDRMKPVVRWLDVDEPLPTLTVEPPLRLLLAIAAPSDRIELQVGTEIAHLDQALAELTTTGQLKISRLEHTTLDSLDAALLKDRPHILHFIGHGDFVDNEGLLILESDTSTGVSDSISGRQLAALLRNHLTCLRLVFLNSCMGATAARSDPFGGVAQSLIRRGIPAVIAMQFAIPDQAAVTLAKHFYRYLAAGQPVDAALTSARAFLYARGYAVEWGAPALHMRAPDGRLFDIVAQPDVTAALIPKMAPAAEPATPEPQSPHQPFPADAPTRTSQRLSWLFAVAGILVMATAGVWWSLSSEPIKQPDVPVVSQPDDAKTPDKIIPDANASVVKEALADLHSGDNSAAANSLEGLLQKDGNALSAENLQDQHAPLVQALADAAVSAFAQDDREQAYRLMGIMGALAPFDSATDEQIAAKITPWLETAAVIAPAAGNDQDHYARRYTVRKGDTLWSIARRLTGNGAQWPAVLSYHNQKVDIGMGGRHIDHAGHIYPGDKIWRAPSASRPESDGFDYHVSRGETLWSIAKRMYGNPRYWRILYEDNAETITDPARIVPGQILILRSHISDASQL